MIFAFYYFLTTYCWPDVFRWSSSSSDSESTGILAYCYFFTSFFCSVNCCSFLFLIEGGYAADSPLWVVSISLYSCTDKCWGLGFSFSRVMYFSFDELMFTVDFTSTVSRISESLISRDYFCIFLTLAITLSHMSYNSVVLLKSCYFLRFSIILAISCITLPF